MATMREIKRRRVSIQNTQQITKAMKLVSTVKLQRAKTRAENSKAYFKYMYKTITSMLAKAGNVNHPFVQGNGSKNVAVVTVTSITGGHNVAFSYGTGDARNTNFDVMDGEAGSGGGSYTAGTGIDITNGVISLALEQAEGVEI